mmetsp:Transcript_17862/g.60320  ORF Transcript_17862/g.60320 Transcript_17862/m.60320 type:complete len:234 (-) Transcript_17862:8-709(-)
MRFGAASATESNNSGASKPAVLKAHTKFASSCGLKVSIFLGAAFATAEYKAFFSSLKSPPRLPRDRPTTAFASALAAHCSEATSSDMDAAARCSSLLKCGLSAASTGAFRTSAPRRCTAVAKLTAVNSEPLPSKRAKRSEADFEATRSLLTSIAACWDMSTVALLSPIANLHPRRRPAKRRPSISARTTCTSPVSMTMNAKPLDLPCESRVRRTCCTSQYGAKPALMSLSVDV